MLSLLLVSLYEFKQFLQIVLWIALPLTIGAVTITTILHYRRKKRKTNAEPAYQDIGYHTVMAAGEHEVPDWLVGSTQPDNTSLLKKYEQELRHSKENYNTLEDDFRKLEAKYSDLLNKAYSTEKQDDDLIKTMQQEIDEYKKEVSHLKQSAAEAQQARQVAQQEKLEAGEVSESHEQELHQLQTTIQQLQEALRQQQEQKDMHAAEIQKLEKLLSTMEQSAAGTKSETAELQKYYARQLEELGRQYNNEKQELIEQLNQSKQLIEQWTENHAAAAGQLHQVETSQQETASAHLQELEALRQSVKQSEEEKIVLKEKLNELQYLEDVVEEKKVNINFLQNQLEQRIKSYHQMEQEVSDKTGQLKQLQHNLQQVDEQLVVMKEELSQKQQEVSAWQQTADHTREQNEQQQEALREKVSRIESLEFTMQELQQQQAALQSVIDDKQDSIMLLQDSVNHEQHKVHELESKLELSNQLLVKIYTELAKSFSAGLMHLQNNAMPGLLNTNGNAQLNGNGRYHIEETEHTAAI